MRQVEGLAPGVYTYDSQVGKLSRIADLIENGLLNSAALGDEKWLEDAPVVIAIIAERALAIDHFAAPQADGLRGARYVISKLEQPLKICIWRSPQLAWAV
ncbi:hypothetical protein D3C86_1484940 [compost metagenome]